MTTQPRILWIDEVGGFLCCDQNELFIGQAVPESEAELQIIGDISRHACSIRRVQSDYILQAFQPMTIQSQPVERPQLLGTSADIRIGRSVELQFTKPHPLSASARLKMVSYHHWKPKVDGVVLLADTCLIGPNPNCHIHCPTWQSELMLCRRSNVWCIRCPHPIEANGKMTSQAIPLTAGLRLRGDDFSLSIEWESC